jgi:isoleucyl-tRNA synthetase
VRKVLLTYWNTAAFHVLYARANHWSPATLDDAPAPARRPLLDRWVRSELHRTVGDVTDALDEFDPTRAGRRLTEFIDDLSNWYVRRSRRRFWDGDPAALATLHECLEVVTRLLAPFMPFISEEVHERLVRDTDSSAPDSVHLQPWPQLDPDGVEESLSAQMSLVRRLVELGRSARVESGMRTRQPLARALVSAPGWEELPEDLRQHVADELNVLTMATLGSAGDSAAQELVDISVKANFRSLGKRYGKRTPQVAAAIQSADAEALTAALRGSGTATVTVDGSEEAVTSDDVVITETPRSGWAVASAGAETVALDLELNDELVAAGNVREVIRGVQEARKTLGLEVTDRIELWWQAVPPVDQALRAAADLVGGEVLAVSVTEGPPAAPLAEHSVSDLGVRFWLRAVG